jgi:5'-3' exonuclease
MGIPYYFYNIYKKYNDLIIDKTFISKLNVGYLFLDYNSLIHPCAQDVLKREENINEKELEKEIIKNCILYTRYIINIVGAKDVYIMIDGVAPRAKMKQQRERRYKTCFFKKLEKKNIESEKEKSLEWDSNKITPGTLFMDSIKIALDKLKDDVKDDYNIYISDSNECGEGEHKMMKEIKKIVPEKRVCIYGLDADLIMLSLMNPYLDKIILLRDNLSEKNYTYVDISKLKKNICNELYAEMDESFNNKNDTNLIYDYIFLCFLLGNDFLEHIPSLMIKENGMTVLLKYYLNLLSKKQSYLVNIKELQRDNLKESIDLQFLQDIFYQLSKSEEYFYNKVYSVYSVHKKDKEIYKDCYNIETVNDDIYIYKKDIIKYNTEGYKKRYYDFYGINDVNDACQNYLNGLYWILGYYYNHIHNNWSWFYTSKAIPFSSDIFKYLLKCNKNEILKIDTLQKSKVNTPLEQLTMVLPKKSLLHILENTDRNLYEKFIRIFNTSSNELNEYYPDKICLDMIHKEFMWQSKIFIKDFKNNFLEYFII